MSEIYDAKKDPQFQKGYIDIDREDYRELSDGTKVNYRYMHGGFEGTDVRFSFCFPEKEAYEGRFYQYLSPFPGPEEEIASMMLTGGDDKIAFALTNGAYYVETNMGSGAVFTNNADNTMTHRSSAAAAEFSRKKAAEIYGDHRPYGYVYGGSGGGYRTIACIENTNAWDGAVPYIIGSPYAIPNCHTTRVHAMRVLRHKMDQIVDAVDAGGSRQPFEGLNEEEADALREVLLFGCPIRSFFSFKQLGDGAVPVLLPGVKQADPDYFRDFWEKPGYLGADPNGSAVRDRIRMDAKVELVFIPGKKEQVSAENVNGADTAWLKMLSSAGGETVPWIELDHVPEGDDLYLEGTNVIFRTGEAKGAAIKLDRIAGNRIYLGSTFGLTSITDVLEKVKKGDEVTVDNSDYIAFQTYHRHQVPSAEYHGWDQYRDQNGEPIYPQQKVLIGPVFTSNGPGCYQNGNIQGKVIIVASLMDESAYAWQADWYRKKIASVHAEDEKELVRLWYVDHSLHDDRAETIDELRVTSYLGALRQALLDLSAWVEKGIEPLPSSNYQVNIGQMEVPETAQERGGLQPVVTLLANGTTCARVHVGDTVHFEAEAEVPEGAGKLTKAEWSFDGDTSFPGEGKAELLDEGTRGRMSAEFIYTKKGTYFAVIRVSSQRNGDENNPFTQVRNLARVRVVVE